MVEKLDCWEYGERGKELKIPHYASAAAARDGNLPLFPIVLLEHRYIARTAKPLVVNKPMAIFHAGHGKSWLVDRGYGRTRDELYLSLRVDFRRINHLLTTPHCIYHCDICILYIVKAYQYLSI